MLLDTASSAEVVSSAEDVVETTVENVVTFWDGIASWFVTNWPNFVICAIVLVGGWWLVTLIIRLMKHGMRRAGIEKSAITFLTSCAKYLLRLIVIILALYPFGLNFTAVLTALGAAGLGLGLGLKEPVANIASGIQLIVTKPFSVGHYIAINNTEGTVQRVEIMFTTLKTLENQEVVIPNSTLTAGTLINYTSLGVRRASFNFNMQYGTDLGRIRTLLLELVKNNPLVLDEPESRFVILGQESDGISCSLRVFTRPEDYWNVFWGINEDISNLFRDEHIRIPFNQLDVHICDPAGKADDPVPTAPKK
jgi:small conductance mechanosensitive channel